MFNFTYSLRPKRSLTGAKIITNSKKNNKKIEIMPKLKKIRLELLPNRGVSCVLINELSEMLVNGIDTDKGDFKYKYIQLRIHLEKIGKTPLDYLLQSKISRSICSDFIVNNLVEAFKKLESND